jgi:hypothetical protein
VSRGSAVGVAGRPRGRSSSPGRVKNFRSSISSRPPLWSSGQEFLTTDPEVRVRFQALPDFFEK